MSFKPGDIVATNRGGIGIYKGQSTAKTAKGKVDFFAVNCDSYNGRNFYLNHINEENLTLATKDHPKYKCIKCIMNMPFSKKPSKDTLIAFKAVNPKIKVGTVEEGYREQNRELLKKGLLSKEDVEELKKQNLI